jgi:hypothetical protein
VCQGPFMLVPIPPRNVEIVRRNASKLPALQEVCPRSDRELLPLSSVSSPASARFQKLQRMAAWRQSKEVCLCWRCWRGTVALATNQLRFP